LAERPGRRSQQLAAFDSNACVLTAFRAQVN
jgi:hypothetical protein